MSIQATLRVTQARLFMSTNDLSPQSPILCITLSTFKLISHFLSLPSVSFQVDCAIVYLPPQMLKTFFTQSSSVLRSSCPNQRNLLLLTTSSIHSLPNLYWNSALVILSCNLLARISYSIFFLISSYFPPTQPKFLFHKSYNF